MKTFALVLMAILCSSGLAGCQTAASSPDDQAEEDRIRVTSENLNRITNREWRLQEMILDGKKQKLVPDSRVTFALKANGGVGGMGSINHYSGSLQINDRGEIQWNDRGFITTKMAGPPELMKQESRFLAALPKTERMVLERSFLLLTSPDETTQLRFVAKPREQD